MSHLPEEIQLKNRRMVQLQLESLNSPMEFNSLGSQQRMFEPGLSPMTDLAMNLSDTSLNSLTPIQDSKRRLSMESDSSTPSPEQKSSPSKLDPPNTPLTSLTAKHRRPMQNSKLSFNINKFDNVDDTEENKENIPISSPNKKSDKQGRKMINKASSCTFSKSSAKRLIPRKFSAPAAVSFTTIDEPSHPLKPKNSLLKKPDFRVVENENCCESDKGSDEYREDLVQAAKVPGSLEDILSQCSPGKDEDGVTPIKCSPDRCTPQPDNIKTDGFDFSDLGTIAEDKSEDSPCIDLNSLMQNKFIPAPESSKSSMPIDLTLTTDSRDLKLHQSRPFKDSSRKLSLFSNPKRMKIRRTHSMFDRSPALKSNSPVSRFNQCDVNISSFKRPEPPRPDFLDVTNKRARIEEVESTSSQAEKSVPDKRPKFFRSHSENHLSVMKACELKADIPNILPDSSRLYALPAPEDTQHPTLRSITCHTLACLLKGEYDDIVDKYRIIDCRYDYEYNNGHIKNAENWSHGDEDQFLKSFLSKTALEAAPFPYNPCSAQSKVKREILIFHCEFSSKRGPDFYKKLRESDRKLNQHVFPGLHYPEIYLLHLGYKEFFNHYPELTTGAYMTMDDPRHQEDYRKMRAKSKSWSGGTIQRTGKQSKMLIM